MKHCLVVLCLVLAGAPAGGQTEAQTAAQAAGQGGDPAGAAPRDPLRTADCERALQALLAREQQAASAPRAGTGSPMPPLASDARYQALRRSAAKSCLGGTDAPPARLAQPPVSVAPVIVAPSIAPPAASHVMPLVAPVLPPTPPPRRADAPAVVTSCDPAGCWASDGSRLNRMGPNLVGPRGLCTQQGVLLQCP
jgi:hypothetical protein